MNNRTRQAQYGGIGAHVANYGGIGAHVAKYYGGMGAHVKQYGRFGAHARHNKAALVHTLGMSSFHR